MLSFVTIVYIYTLIAIKVVGAQDVICVGSSNFNVTTQIAELCIPYLQEAVFINITKPGVDITIVSTLKALQLAPNDCATKAIGLSCQTFYPLCVPVSPTLALPSPACKSKCYDTLTACASFIQANKDILSLLPPTLPSNCDIEDNGVERWPTQYATYNISGFEVNVNCTSYFPDEYVDTNPYSCPFPFDEIYSPSPSEEPCVIKCPIPFFPREEWEQDMTFSYVVAWVSLFCLVFLIISFLLNKNKRSFPQNLFLNLWVMCFVVCVCVIMGFIAGGDAVLCPGKQAATQSYAPCGAQGALIFFSSLSAGCWWFSIVVNLFVMVNAQKKTATVKHVRFYYIFSYGYPFAMTIIALSCKGFGYYAPNIICFLPIQGPQVWMQFALYYVPIGIMMVIGAILNVLIIFKLVKAYYSVAKNVERSLTPYYKVSFFVVFFMFIWICLFTRMGINNNTEVYHSFTQFVACHVTYFSLSVDSVPFCGSVPKVQPEINVIHVQYIAMTVHGILALLLFCYDREIYSGWRKLYWIALEKILGKARRRTIVRREVEIEEVNSNNKPNGSGGTGSDGTGTAEPTSTTAAVES